MQDGKCSLSVGNSLEDVDVVSSQSLSTFSAFSEVEAMHGSCIFGSDLNISSLFHPFCRV